MKNNIEGINHGYIMIPLFEQNHYSFRCFLQTFSLTFHGLLRVVAQNFV